MTKFIEIIKPDDMHLHVRDGKFLKLVVPFTTKQMARAVIMPNLVPPVALVPQAIEYKKRILACVPKGVNFEPLMTLYLTDNTTTNIIKEAKRNGIVAFKLYPTGSTTNSNFGITDILKIFPLLEQMAKHKILLLIHGEVSDSDVDIFDKEEIFIDKILSKIVQAIPDLKIVLEHISTSNAVSFIEESGENIAATVTAHHLLLNRNDLLSGGIKPHNYCMPILKKEKHRQALLKAIVGNKSHKYFLGTDSAPHDKKNKEASIGCAGIFSSPVAIEIYTQIFDGLGALNKLENFASINGAKFYDLKINQEKIKLKKEENIVPKEFEFDNIQLVPFKAGEKIYWKLS